MKRIFTLLSLLTICLLLSSCGGKEPITNVVHPEWSQSAVIYEVNLRQYSQGSTLSEFDTHIPRLAELGIDILWFMPVHPIGIVERKGELGSYYSVKDYKDINPEFGTLEDFRKTVETAHKYGMKVILDWVANHTSRDHAWVSEHPDWFVKDSLGGILAPFDWSDVAQLDLSNTEVRSAMVDAMEFWVEEYDIDGYRCDVAWNVPVDFWDSAFAQLRTIRPDLFFLAEAEDAKLVENAFDAYYGWEMHHFMNDLAQGKKNVAEFEAFIADHAKRFPQNSIALNFTSNHDENSWAGTEFERMGDAARQFAALTFALPGMPMLYSGQEVGLDRRLEFFVHDPILWEDHQGMTEFYKNLISLRDAHPAMYAPTTGGEMKIVPTSSPDVFAFERSVEGDNLLAVFNFSDKEVTFTIHSESLTLPAYGYEFIF